MSRNLEHRCDVLIIGSGAAGLSLALSLADEFQVIVLSKSDMSEGSTRYAQGGIAAVFELEDLEHRIPELGLGLVSRQRHDGRAIGGGHEQMRRILSFEQAMEGVVLGKTVSRKMVVGGGGG